MAKVMNAAFGIGIAVILFIVVVLGVQVFYPSPNLEKICPDYNKPLYYYPDFNSCNETISVKECKDWLKNQTSFDYERDKQLQECYKKFDEENKNYGKNIFIITSLVGIIFVLASLYFISLTNIAGGTAFSGIVLIIYGFARGWQGTGDSLKFVVSLIVAVLFVLAALRLNKRESNQKNRSVKK
ncbi:MAG: hypothetical protein QXX68_03225 [Candidatus Pacearchaeota archaeon]